MANLFTPELERSYRVQPGYQQDLLFELGIVERLPDSGTRAIHRNAQATILYDFEEAYQRESERASNYPQTQSSAVLGAYQSFAYDNHYKRLWGGRPVLFTFNNVEMNYYEVAYWDIPSTGVLPGGLTAVGQTMPTHVRNSDGSLDFSNPYFHADTLEIAVHANVFISIIAELGDRTSNYQYLRLGPAEDVADRTITDLNSTNIPTSALTTDRGFGIFNNSSKTVSISLLNDTFILAANGTNVLGDRIRITRGLVFDTTEGAETIDWSSSLGTYIQPWTEFPSTLKRFPDDTATHLVAFDFTVRESETQPANTRASDTGKYNVARYRQDTVANFAASNATTNYTEFNHPGNPAADINNNWNISVWSQYDANDPNGFPPAPLRELIVTPLSFIQTSETVSNRGLISSVRGLRRMEFLAHNPDERLIILDNPWYFNLLNLRYYVEEIESTENPNEYLISCSIRTIG